MSGQANKSGRTKRKESETKYRGGKTAPTPKRHATPDNRLEQELEGSFPGSDAVAVTQPPHNPTTRAGLKAHAGTRPEGGHGRQPYTIDRNHHFTESEWKIPYPKG
jgi:hypothetical protein